MALRDWSARRILGVWTGWMAGLLVTLLGAVVLNPSGITLMIAPADLPLAARAALGVVGLVGACLPPAILTYAWYVSRLRAWGDRTPDRQQLDGNARERMLAEGRAEPIHRESGERVEIKRKR
jgi:hypothetical protein